MYCSYFTSNRMAKRGKKSFCARFPIGFRSVLHKHKLPNNLISRKCYIYFLQIWAFKQKKYILVRDAWNFHCILHASFLCRRRVMAARRIRGIRDALRNTWIKLMASRRWADGTGVWVCVRAPSPLQTRLFFLHLLQISNYKLLPNYTSLLHRKSRASSQTDIPYAREFRVVSDVCVEIRAFSSCHIMHKRYNQCLKTWFPKWSAAHISPGTD